MTLYDLDGRLVPNAADRYGFTSQEIARQSDGIFEIVLAPRARPGNWLPTGGIDRYVVVLRLYDTPVGRRDPHGEGRADARHHGRELRMIRWLLWLLGGLLLGGIVHLGNGAAAAAHRDAGRLHAACGVGAGEQHGAAARPDAGRCRAAVHGSGLCDVGCRYDLADGPLQAARAGQPGLHGGVVLYAQRASPITRSTTAPPAGASSSSI